MKSIFKFLLFFLLVLSACKVNNVVPPTNPIVLSDSTHSGGHRDSDADGIPDLLEDFTAESAEVIESVEYQDAQYEYAYDEPEQRMQPVIVADQLSKSVAVAVLAPTIPTPGYGTLAYWVDDTMKVGKIHDVTLRISQKGTIQTVTIGLDDAVVETIRVSSSMEVILFDPDPVSDDQKFVILNTTKAEQSVENDTTFTEWAWQVKPIKAGDHQLKLVINMRQKTEFGSSLKSIKVFEKVIKIRSTPSYSISIWWKKNWAWSFGTLIIPFLIFLYKKRKDKNGDDGI